MQNLYLENILKRYGIDFTDNDLKLVLTHSSFAEKSNSRLVFLGQTAFKGAAGEWVFKHIGGTGMQLQQFWGNCFSQSFLETFFDKQHFDIYRIKPDVDWKKQKHIFVYAFFGFIYEKATAENLQRFIFKEIITPNEHLLPSNYRCKNSWDMLILLCRQHYDCRPKIETEIAENNIQQVKVTKNGEIIGIHKSVSYVYARKKAIEKALKHVAAEQETEAKSDEIFLQKEREKAQKAKDEKQQKHLKRTAEHQERSRKYREQKRREAQAADKKRRSQKQEVKEKTSRKGANSIYREYTREEIAAMSNAKRRNLQDRGIIPKGLNF